jgi:hypothetical protein
MKYIINNDIQRFLKKIHMPQNGIVFHVFMWWVANNIKFDLYSFIKVFGHTTWNFLMIYIKSHLINQKEEEIWLKITTQNNIW